MSLLNLPAELLDMIIHDLNSQRDLNALTQTNRALHTLLNARLYLNDINKDDASALAWAAQNDRVETAERVLEMGICTKLKWEQKPLFVAAQNGNEKVMKLLLKRGAKPDCRGPKQTPLYIAVTNEHVKIVKLLLRFKANPNSKNIHPRVLRANTPLHMAASLGNVAIMKKLQARGAKVDALNSQHRTPLHEAWQYGGEACKILLEWGVKEVRKCSRELASAMLHRAVIDGYSKIVQTVLENGVDPDSLDPNQNAPTDEAEAVFPDNSDILRMLLKHGADPNRRSPSGSSLLAGCLQFGRRKNVAMLIEYGADLNEPNSNGDTLLHELVWSLPCVKFLVDHGARLEARSMYGQSPLYRAVSLRQIKTVRYLLLRGSDPCTRSDLGATPLEHARVWGGPDMVMLLEDAIKKRENPQT